MLEKYAGRTDVTRADLLACLDDIGALEKAGKLFTPDTYAGLASEFKRRSNVVKALCLHALPFDFCLQYNSRVDIHQFK